MQPVSPLNECRVKRTNHFLSSHAWLGSCVSISMLRMSEDVVGYGFLRGHHAMQHQIAVKFLGSRIIKVCIPISPPLTLCGELLGNSLSGAALKSELLDTERTLSRKQEPVQ